MNADVSCMFSLVCTDVKFLNVFIQPSIYRLSENRRDRIRETEGKENPVSLFKEITVGVGGWVRMHK